MAFTLLDGVRQRLAGLTCPYWIAGGWALDLFADRVSREHSDVDVLVLMRDVGRVVEAFGSLVLVDESTDERRPWEVGEELLPGKHTLTFPDPPPGPPVQLLLGATVEDEWVFHRGSGRIRRPLTSIGLVAGDGTPYLAPELVLLFKSRGLRDKDHADFQAVAGLLGDERMSWLLKRLPRDQPDHPWRGLEGRAIPGDSPGDGAHEDTKA